MVAQVNAMDLQMSKSNLNSDHKPLQFIVDGIVNDLYVPSGM